MPAAEISDEVNVRTIMSGLMAVAALVSLLPVSGGPGLDAQARSSSGASFTLGVLRRDGIIVPFASYDATRWVNRWPAPGRRPDIPISIADAPKGWWLRERPIATWTAWPLRGDSQVVHVKNPVNLTAECEPHVGLQSDYASVEPRVAPSMQPYPKDGLASAGDVLVEPVEILDGKSPEWASVSADVAKKIAETETTLINSEHVTLPYAAPERAKKAFTLEVLFKSPGPRPGTTMLYFEGIKRYNRVPTERLTYSLGPDLLTYGVGYILVDPNAPPKISDTVTLSDSKREGLVYTMVLGSFRLDGKLFWAVQRSGWGYERYDILEMAEPEAKSVFKTPGGSCR
jgi:hypothetical protein